MSEEMEKQQEGKGLRSREWLLSYKTSSTLINGRPVNMLHDFYIPALSHAVRYDRVAGYFRSSSLAAASRGFSAFTRKGGKMRLIVGADLDPEDVNAILQGDAHRLEERLAEELEGAECWPEGVRNGVTLLAWMVAHGFLEVRVAFRLHLETREPLAWDALDDGYVHEKWFIFTDEYGNRLYGAGSLNESKTALHINAENVDVHCDWWGKIERRRVDEAAQAFERLWKNKVPHVPVLTLPEAVKRQLVRIAEGVRRPLEIDGTSVIPEPVDLPSPVEPEPSAIERLRFAVLRDGPKMPGGKFVGLATAPLEPWPHQEVVVRRLVENWPYSYLLSDEVGLGKTIEAGLAMRCLYLSGFAKRILIVAPASLTRQWHRQMASKMMLPFGRVTTTQGYEVLLPVREERSTYNPYDLNLVIVSSGLLPRKERVQQLKATKPFDVVLVDEAHKARRQNPNKGVESHPRYGQLYKTIQEELRGRTRSLWLATATPMQIHPVEVFDLLALSNRVGAFQFDPSLAMQYYEVLGKLVRGEEPENWEWDFLRRAVKAVAEQDPAYWRFLENHVMDSRIKVIVRRWLRSADWIPRGLDRKRILRFIFSASPLSRVMMRHTRQLLEVYRSEGKLRQNLAQRHILPMPRIVFTEEEKRIYDQLEEYCKGLMEQIRTNTDSQTRQMMSFLLSFLRLRFSSSLFAFARTLERRLQKVEATLRNQLVQEADLSGGSTSLQDLLEEEEEEDLIAVESLLKNRSVADLEWERARLKEMLANMPDRWKRSSKMDELLKVLDKRREENGRIRQTVVFTRFFDTLTDIVDRLRRVHPYMRVGTYSGQGAEYYDPHAGRMVQVDREEVKERFLRGEIDVLVCTDAAAEGLNLQTADLLVNFDLGWNPMTIEQRIGRIDRIGQKHQDIYVLNLCYAGSIEELVYDRLLKRLNDANLIVGTQQLSLLPVGPEEFRKLSEGILTPEELEKIARYRLEMQRKHAESMEMNPRELYEIYVKMAVQYEQQRVPVDLGAIWEALCHSEYLRAKGCTVSEVNGVGVYNVSGLDGIPEGSLLTVSRELYEQGLDDVRKRVHFASYGDVVFDTILQKMEEYELPSCVRRVSVPVPGLEWTELVGYVAVVRGVGGKREVRNIYSWYDLQGLELAEEEDVTEADVEACLCELNELARKEADSIRQAVQIEQENVKVAKAQELLNFYVIYDLLEVRADNAKRKTSFSQMISEVASLIEERESMQSSLPADVFRELANCLLFECQTPMTGKYAHVSVSRILGRTAVDAAKRLADKAKEGKGELKVSRVLESLKREVEERLKDLKRGERSWA